MSVAYAIIGPFLFARHLHHVSAFDPTYNNTPIYLFGLIGLPLAAVPIALGSRIRPVPAGTRPGASPNERRNARLLGLVGLGLMATVVLFFVVLKMLGLPDHPFG
jgi:hypothetical protein